MYFKRKIDESLIQWKNDSVHIFDEIQEYPDVATTLKSFRLDGKYDVICSGSMLGINYKKIHSNSVGNKTDYEMFSMDFEEFLWAKGYHDGQIQDILKHMIALTPFSETELSVYKSLFFDFCVLGGMPDVVRGYIETGTFSNSLETQEQIRLDYEEDARKYAEGLDQAKIISVYRSVPAQLAKENSTLEEDFFVRTRNELNPVEVKSNNDSSKSLVKLIKNENYSEIQRGIKLGDNNVGYANNIYTFPYFCAFMMKVFLKNLD